VEELEHGEDELVGGDLGRAHLEEKGDIVLDGRGKKIVWIPS